jgi:ParB-like chromosome segregation protein Spo0J
MTENEAEQMLAMMVTGTIRYTPDPVSQALHYRRLMQEEGYTVRQIADATGIHSATIQNRLRLLLLDEEIQELVARKELHADPRVVEALLSVENSTARVKIAKKLAQHRASIKAIVGSCQRLVKNLQEQKAEHSEGTPALNLASAGADRKIHPAAKVPWKKVRTAAGSMCNACEMRLTLLKGHPEPAWSIIAHATEETCNSCSVREVRQACAQCPAVTILQHLAKSTRP